MILYWFLAPSRVPNIDLSWCMLVCTVCWRICHENFDISSFWRLFRNRLPHSGSKSSLTESKSCYDKCLWRLVLKFWAENVESRIFILIIAIVKLGCKASPPQIEAHCPSICQYDWNMKMSVHCMGFAPKKNTRPQYWIWFAIAVLSKGSIPRSQGGTRTRRRTHPYRLRPLGSLKPPDPFF